MRKLSVISRLWIWASRLQAYSPVYGDFLRVCHVTLYTVFLHRYLRLDTLLLDTLVIIIMLLVLCRQQEHVSTLWSRNYTLCGVSECSNNAFPIKYM